MIGRTARALQPACTTASKRGQQELPPVCCGVIGPPGSPPNCQSTPRPAPPEHHQPVEQAVVVIPLEACTLTRPCLVQPLCASSLVRAKGGRTHLVAAAMLGAAPGKQQGQQRLCPAGKHSSRPPPTFVACQGRAHTHRAKLGPALVVPRLRGTVVELRAWGWLGCMQAARLPQRPAEQHSPGPCRAPIIPAALSSRPPPTLNRPLEGRCWRASRSSTRRSRTMASRTATTRSRRR